MTRLLKTTTLAALACATAMTISLAASAQQAPDPAARYPTWTPYGPSYQQPTYAGQRPLYPGYGAPGGDAVERELYSPAMLGIGTALVTAGVSTVALGALVYIFTSSVQYSVSDCVGSCEPRKPDQTVATSMLVAGTLAVAGSIPLMVIGGRTVEKRGVSLRFGASSLSLGGHF